MKIKIFYFVIAWIFLLNMTIVAQQTGNRTTKIKGTEYYIYSVEPSEGLFAIGRKFNVSVDEIIKANPDARGGLKVGQQLLVPKNAKASFREPSESNLPKTPEFIQHKVLKKQTLFSICKKYGVSQQDIEKYNPQIVKGLTEGIVLQIPKPLPETNKKELPQTAHSNALKQEKTATTHRVQKNETLYSISKKHHTTVPDIIENNPGIGTTIEIGTELIIPMRDTLHIATPKPVEKTHHVDTIATSGDVEPEEKKMLKIAYLLPFMLNDEKADPFIDRFIDFYAGSLLAIKEAKEKGISLEISVYDTEKTEDKIVEVLASPELREMDLIVGPAFTNQVSRVARFAEQYKINTLIPFTAKVPEIDSNPYLFQFNPGAESELLLSKELLTAKFKNANLIFAEILGISSYDEGRIWVDALKSELNTENRSFSTLKLITVDDANFSSVLKTNAKNIVIFNTDKFEYVQPFLSPLLEEEQNFKILLFKQYRWKNETEKMPRGIYLSAFKSVINSSLAIRYNQEFSENFEWEISKDSPRFDLLGYDLSNYFITLLHQYSTKFKDKIKFFNVPNDIQSEPKFDRKSLHSGFINERLYLIEENE